jgi:flagellar protein FlgJ
LDKKQKFINLVLDGAQEVQRSTGMFASVTIAQAIHETGWGRSTPKDKDNGSESYNLFGRKAKNGENYVTSKTWEVYDGKRVEIYAKFKKFNSYTDSVLDRSGFLKSQYYQKACKATNPMDACDFLIKTGVFGTNGKEIGYATDPSYSDLLKKIINSNNLTQYDLPKEDEEEMAIKDDFIKLQQVVEDLTKENKALKEKLTKIENEMDMDAIPDWAKDAVNKAVSSGVLKNSSSGSKDFYRILTVLHRKGLL